MGFLEKSSLLFVALELAFDTEYGWISFFEILMQETHYGNPS
jgi:hypothetical protein